MSLKPEGISPVPEETARIAHAAYPKGNVFMHMRDELGTIYEDESFAHLFSHTGQPAEAPWRLALVTIMQFARSAFPIGKPLMRFAVALIGNMRMAARTR
jgi:transposase